MRDKRVVGFLITSEVFSMDIGRIERRIEAERYFSNILTQKKDLAE